MYKYLNKAYNCDTETDINLFPLRTIHFIYAMKNYPFLIALAVLSLAACNGEGVNPQTPQPSELHIGDFTSGGVVVYVDPINKTAGKVLSLTYEKELQWCDLCERVGSLSSSDGVANSAKIKSSKYYPENYPALLFCDEMGKDWYLPAIDEWKDVFILWNGGSTSGTNEEARAEFDQYFIKAGGAPLNPDGETTANGQSYWSSTEDTGSNINAYYLRFGNYGNAIGTKKSQNRLTRCMKVVGNLTPAPVLELDATTAIIESSKGSYAAIPYRSNNSVSYSMENPDDEAWLEVRISASNVIFVAKEANEAKTARSTYVKIIAGTPEYNTSVKVYVTQEEGIKQTSHLREVHEGGIVFWQNVDNEKDVKIISLSRYTASKGWCETDAQDIKCGADSLDNGVANTAAIVKAAQDNNLSLETFHAVHYCKSLGEGWYLPAKNELLSLFATYNGVKNWEMASTGKFVDITEPEKTARRSFEAILSNNGGDVFDSMGEDPAKNGDSYFSSTEDPENVQKVYYLRVGSLDNVTQTKRGTARYVRCVKRIELK